MNRILLALGLLLLAGSAANAACPRACTVTGSSTTMFTIAGNKHYLNIINLSATDNVACNVAGGTAALNTAGNYPIAAGTSLTWNITGEGNMGGILPLGAFNCISSGTSTPITIDVR